TMRSQPTMMPPVFPRESVTPYDRGADVKPAENESLRKALPPSVPNLRPFVPPRPAFRCLRGYSIDPSLTTRLETSPISEITFKIPWETVEPGPVGEYLEVV